MLPVPPAGPVVPPVSRATGGSREHHRAGGGFRNPWPGSDDAVDAVRAARWMAGRAFTARPAAAAPRVALAPADLAAPEAGVAVTWLGHASVLLRSPTATVIVDPVFSDRVSPVAFAGPRRAVALPVDPAALPPVSTVVVTHDHYDHLDAASVRFLHRRDAPLFVCPLGVAVWLRSTVAADVRVAELDWWDALDLPGGVRATATPTRHFSGRRLTNRDGTLWLGVHLAFDGGPAGPTVVYNVGDTAACPVFAEVARRLPAADLALVPVGAYSPRWFMSRVHVDPAGALDVFEATGARAMVATHWGTFDLADEPLDEPPRLLLADAARRGLAARVTVLPVGGQVRVTAPTSPAG